MSSQPMHINGQPQRFRMMVLESGVLPPTLRLYAEAIAAVSNNRNSTGGNGPNSSNANCFSSNHIMAPHPLFPHFAAGRGFPSMFSGLPPFLQHSSRSPVTHHPRFNPANLLTTCSSGASAASNQQRSNENHPRLEIPSPRRQRHHTSNSDDSTDDPMSPKKGKNAFFSSIRYLIGQIAQIVEDKRHIWATLLNFFFKLFQRPFL